MASRIEVNGNNGLIERFLIDEYAQGKRSVLIIDEAQNLSARTLEELRMLSNINADKNQLLQIVLVGQPQLKELLNRPDLVQFAQRVSSDFHISAFSVIEVARYIHHRLKVAGRSEPLFDAAAVHRIANVTGGVPRSINILCDAALVYGYALEAPRISRVIIDEVIRDKSKYGVFGPIKGEQSTPV